MMVASGLSPSIISRMSHPAALRLLETDNNKRGDLFTTLVRDLFLCLGYEDPRLNIHKGGYELDVKALHLDGSIAVAECKATKDLPGGTELGEFAGNRLARENNANKDRRVVGYFVSLFGYKESGIEAERAFSPPRFTLLDGSDVIDHLIKGQRLCEFSVAADQAGRCLGKNPELKLDPTRIVVAHQRGLFWAVCYQRGAVRSHVVLVAADGSPAQAELAHHLVQADQQCGGDLHTLHILNPDVRLGQFTKAQVDATREASRRYLEHECGFMSIEGLSADDKVSSKRFALEDIFVPQRLLFQTEGNKKEESTVARSLETKHRLAILASPGGGKSTLLKRLALAYADPSRRGLVADGLPNRDWFPIFLRCRDLRELASQPLIVILRKLAEKDHLSAHAEVFLTLAQDALQQGKALLLIDGLDEISDDAARAALVSTLRAALDVWPQTTLVVTSREAGFRHVAPHLAPFCQQATLTTLDEGDIRNLAERWHIQVEGDSPAVRKNARALAERIIGNDRVRQLAGNPLLLTTLFLVKRQTGDLPTGRAKLYAEAVKVLLWSWNVQGFTRIDPDDAVPRLAWVAYDMMKQGVQRISKPRLRASLHAANRVLEDTFGLRHLDPADFIDRVEYRSSLLMMTGKEMEDGQLQDFYEFRHLTFQEYLCALACVDGWHAGRKDTDTLASVLQPHLEDKRWKEVIPLAAVLGGRQTAALLMLMIEPLKQVDPMNEESAYQKPLLVLLMQCLADEAPASAGLIEEAALALLANSWAMLDIDCNVQFWAGRHGETMRKAVAAHLESSMWAASVVYVLDARIEKQFDLGQWGPGGERAFAHVIKVFRGSVPVADGCTTLQHRVEAVLLVMVTAFSLRLRSSFPISETERILMEDCQDQLCDLLSSDHPAERHAAAWAFRWFHDCDSLPSRVRQWVASGGAVALPPQSDVLGRLIHLALNDDHPWMRRFAGLALACFPLIPEGRGHFGKTVDNDLALNAETLHSDLSAESRELTTLIVAWYRRQPWTDADLLQRAQALEVPEYDGDLKRRRNRLISLLEADLRSQKVQGTTM